MQRSQHTGRLAYQIYTRQVPTPTEHRFSALEWDQLPEHAQAIWQGVEEGILATKRTLVGVSFASDQNPTLAEIACRAVIYVDESGAAHEALVQEHCPESDRLARDCDLHLLFIRPVVERPQALGTSLADLGFAWNVPHVSRCADGPHWMTRDEYLNQLVALTPA